MRCKKHSSFAFKRTTMVRGATAALVALFAIGMLFYATSAPAEAAKRQQAYVYAKVMVTSSDIDGISAEDKLYFAWESGKPLRITVADGTDQVTTAKLANAVVTNGDSQLTMSATVSDSSVAGLNTGDVLTCSFDLVAETASCVNGTTGGSVSGHSVYVNVGTSTRGR